MTSPNTDINLFEVENKNISTSLELFEIVRQSAEEYCSFINKYKECTSTYYDKISKITFNIKKDSITTDKNLNISSILPLLNKIPELIKIHINGIKKFIDSLDLSIKPLENVLKQNIDTLDEVKKQFEENKKKYTKNINKHKNLMDIFSQIEKKLIKYYLTKKKQKDYTEERNSLKSNLKEAKYYENDFLETTNKGKNYHMLFQEDSLKNIEDVKSHIKTILENIKGCVYFFIYMFDDCYSSSVKLAQNENKEMNSKPIDINKLINETMLIETYSLEELPSDKYTIKILNNPKVKRLSYSFSAQNEIVPKFDFATIINFLFKNDEINEDEIFANLNKIDLLGIAKKMYVNYKMVSENGYDIKMEEEKIRVKKYADKLILMKKRKKSLTKKINDDITKEEKKRLFDMVKKKENAEIFLTRLNKIRIYGVFDYPNEIYDDISKIFLIILDNIDMKEDTFLIQFIIILSQTFYRIEKDVKEYLYKSIRKHKIFHMEEMWRKLLDFSITEKSEQFHEIEYKIGNGNDDEQRRKNKIMDIIFAQIIAIIHNMLDFEFDFDLINKIMIDYINKYNLTETHKLLINEMINSKKTGKEEQK